ncbi:MAG TPA: GAF domain-containing protein [Kofleriaceae bacterium]|jgi:K+-sensing histidine kinase KdpD
MTEGWTPGGSPAIESPAVAAELSVDALLDIVGAFAEATTDLDQLLSTIARRLSELVGDLCTIFLLSPDATVLQMKATYDSDPEVMALVAQEFGTKPFAIMPIQQRVLDTGEPLLIPHVAPVQLRTTTTEHRANFTEQIGVHSLVLVALRVSGESIGLLNVLRHRSERGPYGPADRALVQRLADHAAVSIVNARRLAHEQERVSQAMEHAEAVNQELESFTATIAHELRGHLRAIHAQAETLHEQLAERLSPDESHTLDRIQQNSAQLNQLVSDMYKWTRIAQGALTREPVNISGIAQSILQELSAQTPARPVAISIADRLIVPADYELVRGLLGHLLRNAWKFTAHRADAAISVGVEAETGEMIFFVRDNGIGINTALGKEVFVPAIRGKDPQTWGMSLASAQRIVHRHGGRIWVEATPGGGATFRFTLSG